MSVERQLKFCCDGGHELFRKDFVTAGQAAEAIRNDDLLFPVVIALHEPNRLIVESPYTHSLVEFTGPDEELGEIRQAIKHRPMKEQKTGPSSRQVAAAILEHRGPGLPH